MKLVQRPYQPGDEDSINKLYKRITGTDRSIKQYRWEWIDTWDGQGGIWLAFDKEREEGDQLIMQYSLIPTPFSVWGESYLAGKTENCMSHPDCRGQGAYYPHEQQYFEEAKKRFHIFFTTTGDVAKGAPGAVRRKLGYRAFDAFVQLVFIMNPKDIEDAPRDESKPDNSPFKRLNILLWCKRFLLRCYFSFFIPQKANSDINIVEKDQSPLKDIENLWRANKHLYGVTVDRTESYLDWRINKNPYLSHKYLLYIKNGELKGYIIFYEYKGTVVKVVDILAYKKDKKIFKIMIKQLILYAKSTNTINEIICRTTRNNQALRRIFYSCGFLSRIDVRRFAGLTTKKNLSMKRPFHVYISDSVLERHPNAFKESDWYMTELIFEGREN